MSEQTHTHSHALISREGSLQLFRDSPRHTHRHTPCSELCEDNGGSSLINSSITLSLLCIAPLLPSCSCICERVSVLQQTRGGWGLCGGLGQLQSRVTLICCVPDKERPTEDFPFIGCPPPSAFGPFLSVTLHSHVQIQLYSRSSRPFYVNSIVPEHLTNKNVSRPSLCLTFGLQLADLFGAIPSPNGVAASYQLRSSAVLAGPAASEEFLSENETALTSRSAERKH